MDPHFEQLIEYVLEILPEDQRLQVKVHLDSGCEDCNHEVLKLQDTFHLLACALPASKVDAALKSKITDAINAE